MLIELVQCKDDINFDVIILTAIDAPYDLSDMEYMVNTIKAADELIMNADNKPEMWVALDEQDIGYKQIENVADLEEFINEGNV